MTVDFDAASQDVPDSEAESMVVHNSGDACIDDLTSDCETDFELEAVADFHGSIITDPLLLDHRAKTRILSRSHSASDLKDQGDKDEPPRRNSSGECPQSLFDGSTPSPKPSPSILLSDLDLSRYWKGQGLHRLSVTPTSSVLQLSPVNPQHWRTTPQPNRDGSREDNFSTLLHSTAEKVLEKLKSRQLDLGGAITGGQKFQRKHSLGLQPAVPRKLQPLQRDGSKTPRVDIEVRSVGGDSDLGPFSAA